MHVSADYPDPLRPDKPKAFSNLVEVAQDCVHRVISINRLTAVTGNIEALPFADAGGTDHQAVVYPALPRGLRFRQSLQRLAAWIVQDCRRRSFVPDLVHAHKLTVEGTVGQLVAQELGVPLAVSIQGKTDAELTTRAFWLRALFQSVWRDAALIMPLAPWAQAKMTLTLGETRARCHALPCPTKADQLIAPRLVAEPVIRSAFNLKDSARKNAAGLIRAAGIAGRRIPALRLEIIGGGSPAAFADLSRLADRSAPGQVSILGAVGNEKVQALFNSAAAFALVSHRESFGMVFAEALLSGAPCLIPSSQGIEGFFEPGEILLDADPKK